jgi:formamidopyrimidine-DNA glycosylase
MESYCQHIPARAAAVPELPDITVYLEALTRHVAGHTLERAEIAGPSLLRTTDPPPSSLEGRTVTGLDRIGKRIAVGFDNGIWLLLHLMIAGRLHWSAKYKRADGRRILAAFVFDSGCLSLTEAGSQKRASLHIVRGRAALGELDPGGIDVFAASPEQFARALRSGNHTLKRALTDPRTFSGIGNAYSDEILHRAQLSPIALTSKLSDAEVEMLRCSAQEVLNEWTARLREASKGRFPEGVTAFRPEMAVHGKYGQPCPRCGTKVQRIRYASNETNYCPQCQTGGRLLADRALSRLLREDWPRTLEELEELRQRR